MLVLDKKMAAVMSSVPSSPSEMAWYKVAPASVASRLHTETQVEKLLVVGLRWW
jgi:hypothetical protein